MSNNTSLGHLAAGLIMGSLGGYLLLNQVTVGGSYWSFWGSSSFGITLLPLLFGVAILFFKSRSLLGWFLTTLGTLFVFAGIIANLHIYFQPTSLFNALVILILLVGGVALVARSLFSRHSEAVDAES